jgi:Ulp1 family protease
MYEILIHLQITSDTKFVLVPINPRNTHWSVMLIDRVAKKFVYYDSMGSLDVYVAAELQIIA